MEKLKWKKKRFFLRFLFFASLLKAWAKALLSRRSTGPIYFLKGRGKACVHSTLLRPLTYAITLGMLLLLEFIKG